MKTINLVNAMERGLKEVPDDWDDFALHISDLGAAIDGEGCLRQVWYRINGYERREDTPGKLWMFKQGHRIHELVPELLDMPDGWYVAGIEEKTTVGGLTGGYDLSIFRTRKHSPGTTVIVDFKTIRGAAFGYLNEPKKSHVAQLQGYLKAENADYGILLYIDREGSNGFLQFRVERDDEATKERCDVLERLPGTEKPPGILEPQIRLRANKNDQAIYVTQPWQCNYCDYCDVSCPGAVPANCRTDKVAGKVKVTAEEDEETETLDELMVDFDWKVEYPDELRGRLQLEIAAEVL